MVEAHLPLLLSILLALAFGGLMLGLGIVLGPSRPSKVKSEAFESGMPSSGTARDRFNVRFYLVAILFLVFDIEAVFIYPWAVVFSDAARGVGKVSASFAILEMLTFVAVILVGLTYAWRKGALEWGPEMRESFSEQTTAATSHSHSHSHSSHHSAVN
jgi:NADH-quinone oxidoreductase subunit A